MPSLFLPTHQSADDRQTQHSTVLCCHRHSLCLRHKSPSLRISMRPVNKSYGIRKTPIQWLMLIYACAYHITENGMVWYGMVWCLLTVKTTKQQDWTAHRVESLSTLSMFQLLHFRGIRLFNHSDCL